MRIRIKSVTLHSRTQGFCISYQITCRCQKALDKRKFDRDQKFNQQSDFLMDHPEKGEQVTPCMDIYKKKSNMMEVLTS